MNFLSDLADMPAFFVNQFMRDLHNGDTLGCVLGGTLMFLVGLLVLVPTVLLVGYIINKILYECGYKPPMISDGKIISLEYVPAKSSTTYMYNAALKMTVPTTTHTPSKHLVEFETEQGETCIDSKSLYDKVEEGDEIEVKYQERLKRYRFWASNWKKNGLRLISIETSDGSVVRYNSIKGR